MDKQDLRDKLIGIYFKKCYFGVGKVTEEEEEFIKQDIKCIPTGRGGWYFDKDFIKEHLEVGKEYTLDSMNVGQSSSTLTLKEVPGKSFNTVCFDYKIK
jgi:hypothetical protein